MDAYDGKLLAMLREFGDIIMQDDGPDIGKFDRIHHWHIGAAIKYGVDLWRMALTAAEVRKAFEPPAIEVLRARLEAIRNSGHFRDSELLQGRGT